VIPALRWDSFQGTHESLLTSKLELKDKISESLQLRAAWGTYVQEPEPQELSKDYGNPDIKAPHAEHFAVGFDKDFREGSTDGWKWNLSFFNRKFNKLVIPSSALVMRDGALTLENVNNNGTGKAYGFETLFKFDSLNWNAWIAYTYSRSTRVSPPREETLFEFDQTHSLNLIGSIPFGNNWTVASRYRFTTGSPFTPVVDGVFDSDSDVYMPIRGGLYSQRYNHFSQLDLRFDKKWILDEEIWSIYIDIQNLLNQTNSETIQYSYNYKQKGSVSGLPIVPSIGLKGEF
jgi:outer membrane cobalamin receptor